MEDVGHRAVRLPDPQTPEQLRKRKDDTHLKLLEVFYYVSAGLSGFYGLSQIITCGMGVLILTGNVGPIEGPESIWLGWGVIAIGVVAFFVSLGLAAMGIVIARLLKHRRRYGLCMVLTIVFTALGGIILGVFTIVVLLRDGVKAQFQAGQSAEADEPDDGLAVAGVKR